MSPQKHSTPLRFAAAGAGFWARYQLSAWMEVAGAHCVAVCDVQSPKAEELARSLGIAAAYGDLEEMIAREKPDFIDVITGPNAHVEPVRTAARLRTNVICQKPLAPTLAEAEDMARVCREAGVKLLAHENWRWQAPIRRLHDVLREGSIGQPFRARIDMISGFPVFQNQPYLKQLEELIIADLGVHILDVARFLFGEPEAVYCRKGRVHRDIRGEDVATVVLECREATVVCNMAYAGNALERERFPETFIFVEGSEGSVELCPDYWVRVTTRAGTHARRHPPPRHAWADPAYDVVHASMVPTNANLLADLRGEADAETTAADNLKTLRLVFAAYRAAREQSVVRLG